MTLITLPSGKTILAPTDPATWVDQGPTTLGTPVTASALEADVSGAVAFARRRPLFQGSHTAAVSVPSGTWTPIPMSTELIDSNAGHADGSNTSRVAAGYTWDGNDWYLCTGYVPWAAGDADQVHVAGLRRSADGVIYEGMKIPGGAAHAATCLVVDLLHVASGGYIELMAWQNSGAALSTVASASKRPSLTMRWACANAGIAVAAPGVPRTWTSADEITADLAGTNQVPLNRHVRDVARWLRYPPTARLHTVGTTQTIATGTTWTSINFVGENIDNYGGHDNVTNPSRYTAQRPGLYYVYGLAAHGEPGTGGGYRACRLLVNGTTPIYGMSSIPPLTTSGTALAASAHVRLNAGDYVELQLVHGAGSSQPVANGAGNHARLIVLWRSL